MFFMTVTSFGTYVVDTTIVRKKPARVRGGSTPRCPGGESNRHRSGPVVTERHDWGERSYQKYSFSIPLVKDFKALVLGINRGSFQTPFSIPLDYGEGVVTFKETFRHKKIAEARAGQALQG